MPILRLQQPAGKSDGVGVTLLSSRPIDPDLQRIPSSPPVGRGGEDSTSRSTEGKLQLETSILVQPNI